MTPISIFGTSSDAGKSTLTFVIAKIIQNAGYTVAPFKAQNVSNNSRVADDGSEIAIAQFFQAEVLGVPTSYHLNPILLKSGRGNNASMIVNGRIAGEKEVREYYRDLDTLKPFVDDSFTYLQEQYDCVVCEGAGSPVELNLMDKDLSNIYIANRFQTKIILVADIERGGVFASIWGVYNLLPENLRSNVIGVIVNKFRGDMSLFDEGFTNKHVSGSFVHGIFENNDFRTHFFRRLNSEYIGYDFQKRKTAILDEFIGECVERIDGKRLESMILIPN